MSRLTRDGTAEPVSRDQILRHAQGQMNVHLPCLADHEQDWQPYPVDPHSAICDVLYSTYIHTLEQLWLGSDSTNSLRCASVPDLMESYRTSSSMAITTTACCCTALDRKSPRRCENNPYNPSFLLPSSLFPRRGVFHSLFSFV